MDRPVRATLQAREAATAGRHNLWDAIDRHRTTVQVLGALSLLAVTAAAVLLVLALAFLGSGRPDLLALALSVLLLELLAGVITHATRTRRGTGLFEQMRAVECTDASACRALADAGIATGHKTPPRLFVSEHGSVNAAILGHPGSASWRVVATNGFLQLTPREQAAAYTNLISRRPDRLLSWPFASFMLLIASVTLAGWSGVPAMLGTEGSPVPLFLSPLLGLVLLVLGMLVYGYVARRIALLTDEVALLRSKEPEAALSGLIKAGFIGSRVPECEGQWHFLFWCMPQGIDARLHPLRVAAAEALGGAAVVGVRESAAAEAARIASRPSGSWRPIPNEFQAAPRLSKRVSRAFFAFLVLLSLAFAAMLAAAGFSMLGSPEALIAFANAGFWVMLAVGALFFGLRYTKAHAS